jgi:hypothetical protein
MVILDTRIVIAVMNRRDEAIDLGLQHEIAAGGVLIALVPGLVDLHYGAAAFGGRSAGRNSSASSL